MVVGSCGAGKSTVAREIGRRLGLPVIHLDAEFWRPGWVEPNPDDWRAHVAMLAARDAWVMDGQYSGTWNLRAARADTIIWLDLPRRVYFWRVLKRTVIGYGKVRADIGLGCPERFDPAFLRWVWNYSSRSRAKMVTLVAAEATKRYVVTLRTQRDVETYFANLPAATARRVSGPAGTA
jgi:adenylate kinase family enzyme